MPRRHRHRHRTMKGGFWDSLSSTVSGWGSSLSEGASSIWGETKKSASSLSGSTDTSSSTTYTPTPQTTTTPMTTSTFGGKHRRSRRHMRGGFQDNTPTTGLAAHAASFSGPTAQPQTIVGGRTRRRGRKGGFLGEVINQAAVPVAILGLQQNYRRKKGGKTRRHRKH
jgi:hypothetical protein